MTPTPTPAATTPTSDLSVSQEQLSRAAWKQGVLGALNFLAAILAVRIILLVAVGGAIALTWLGATEHDPYRLAAVGAYTITVVLPLVWLAGRR